MVAWAFFVVVACQAIWASIDVVGAADRALFASIALPLNLSAGLHQPSPDDGSTTMPVAMPRAWVGTAATTDRARLNLGVGLPHGSRGGVACGTSSTA